MSAPPEVEIDRGRRKVLLLVGGLFLIESLESLYSLVAGSLQPLDVVFPAFLLSAGVALWRGRQWARWVLVVGIGLSAITLLMFASVLVGAGARSAPFATILGLLELAVAVSLLVSSDVAGLSVRRESGTR